MGMYEQKDEGWVVSLLTIIVPWIHVVLFYIDNSRTSILRRHCHHRSSPYQFIRHLYCALKYNPWEGKDKRTNVRLGS